jgi:hypothetical protein
MDKATILDRISRGRTDLVFELLKFPDWKSVLEVGDVKPLQWFVYYNDTTALKAVLHAGGDLSSIDQNRELGHASFFGQLAAMGSSTPLRKTANLSGTSIPAT